MSFFSVLVLAVGLAMDAMAAAAARGVAAPKILTRHVALVALLFGGFQAGMPMVGWALGATVGPFIRAWDHWVAFAVLLALGIKMLHEAWTADGSDEKRPDAFAIRGLVLLAIGTSIDALAAGITLPLIGAPFVVSIVTIGVTTAALSAVGVLAGRRFGALLGRKLDVLGGVLLIAIGTRILLQHLAED